VQLQASESGGLTQLTRAAC